MATTASTTAASPAAAAAGNERPSVPKQPFRVSMLHHAPTLGIASTLVSIPGNNVKASSSAPPATDRPSTRGAAGATNGSSSGGRGGDMSPMRSHPPACAVLFLNPTLQHTGWTELECIGNAPPGRRNHVVVALDGTRIAVHGGERASGTKHSDLFILQLGGGSASTGGAAQSPKAPTPGPLSASPSMNVTAATGDGRHNDKPPAPVGTAAPLQPSAPVRLRPRSWTEVTRSPYCDSSLSDIPALSHHAGVARGDGIFVCGGYGADDKPNTLLYGINLRHGAAMVLADLRLPLVDHQVALDGPSLIIYGGTWADTGRANTDVFAVDPYAEATRAHAGREDAIASSSSDDEDAVNPGGADGDAYVPRDLPPFVVQVSQPVPRAWLRRISQWAPIYFDVATRCVVKCHPRVTFSLRIPAHAATGGAAEKPAPAQQRRKRSASSRSEASEDLTDYEDEAEDDESTTGMWTAVAGHLDDLEPVTTSDGDNDDDAGPGSEAASAGDIDSSTRESALGSSVASSSAHHGAAANTTTAAPAPVMVLPPTPPPQSITEEYFRSALPTPWAVIDSRLYLVIRDALLAFDCIERAWIPDPVGRVAKVAHILPRVTLPAAGPAVAATAAGGGGSPNSPNAASQHPGSAPSSMTARQSKLLVRYPATPSTPIAAPYRPFPPNSKPSQPAWVRTASRAGSTAGVPLLPTLLPKLPVAKAASADGAKKASTVPVPPHTARPRGSNGKFETPRQHKRREQAAQREVHNSALHKMAVLCKSSDAETTATINAINAQTSVEGATVLDVSCLNQGKMTLAIVFLVEKALPTTPSVCGLHVAGCFIDTASCDALYRMIGRVTQVQSVTGLDTAKLCNGDSTKASAAEERILDACAVNRKTIAEAEERRKARRQARKERRQLSKQQKLAEAELPAFRRRVRLMYELLRAHVQKAERFLREEMELLEIARRDRLRLLAEENVRRLLEYMRKMELFRAALAEVARRETVGRDAVVNEQLKEHVTLSKLERDDKRKVLAIIMTREKRMKAEQEAVYRDEKAKRTEIKAEEEHDLRPIREGAKFWETWKRDQEAAKEAERLRLEREQQRLEREKAERQRKLEEQEKRIRDEFDALIREQNNKEKDIVNDEKKAYLQLQIEINQSQKRVEAIEAKRKRFADRATCFDIAPIMNVDKWNPTVPWCVGSDGPVSVADPNASFTCAVVTPDYTGQFPSLTFHLSDLQKSGTALTESERSSTSDYFFTTQTRNATVSRSVNLPKTNPLDPDELPTADLVRQMKTVVEVVVTVTLDASAHPRDEVVLDNDEWVVDKSNGVITSFRTGDVIGKLEPAFATTRPPPPPPIPVDEDATPRSRSITPSQRNASAGHSGFDLDGSRTGSRDASRTNNTTSNAAADDTQDGDLPEGIEPVAVADAKPPPPLSPPPPTTQTLSITIPVNSKYRFTMEEVMAKVARYIAFVRPADVSVTEPVTGTIQLKISTLAGRELAHYGAVPAVPVDMETGKPLGEAKYATPESVVENVGPADFGHRYNTVLVATTFTVVQRPAIIALPSELHFTTMHEGTRELPLFPASGGAGVQVELPPNVAFADCTLWLDMGPLVHEMDHLWFANNASGLSLTSSGDGLMAEGVLMATLESKGNLAADVPETWTKGMPSKVVFKLTPQCTVAHLRSLVAAVVFMNESRNPSDTARYTRIGISIPSLRLLSSAVVGIRFETVDDPTVVDFGAAGSHVTYHTDVNVPAALKDIVPVDRFYFASFCDVYDVDTTDFTGGSLTVRITDADPLDNLDLVFANPFVELDLTITSDGIVVLGDRPQGKFVVRQSDQFRIDFYDTSIDVVAAMFRSLTFQTRATPAFATGTLQRRHVEASLVVEDAAPVVAQCVIHITAPLLIVPASYANVTYQENGGAVRLCPIDATLDDEGWDGGWVACRFLSGGTADDRISLREDDELKLVDPANPQLGAPLRAATANKMPLGLRKKIKEILMKRRKELLARRNAIRTKFDALVRAKENMADAAVKVVMVRGVRVGVVYMKEDSIFVMFDEKINLDATSRYDMCSVHRGAVAVILKRITFENVSDDPQELHKVVIITANDGLPHSTTAAVQVTVEPQDDVTEIVRPAATARDFRSQSEGDRNGYCLFDDCEVQDPDTFVFNGAVLSIDLVGGGDPKGDQLGFLVAAEQRRRFPDEAPIVLDDTNSLVIGEFAIAKFDLDLPNAEGTSNVRITFCPLPSHINLKPIDPLGPPLPEGTVTITSHDQAATTEGLVTIQMVQRVLRAVTYTNTASKVKVGMRYYQARIGFAGAEGKLKLPLNVAGQLLWNPDFGAEVVYRENAPPLPMLPKVVINMMEKDLVKSGNIRVSVAPFDEHDALGIDMRKADGISLSKEKDRVVVGARDPGCRVTYPERGCIFFNFDATSKINVKQVNTLLRSLTFVVNSDSPTEVPRTVFVEWKNDAGVPLGDLRAKIIVQGEDDPTEISIANTQISVARCCAPQYVCPQANVTDPDTTEFDGKTSLTCEIRGGLMSDHLLVLGRGITLETEIRAAFLDPTLNPATPPSRGNPKLNAPGGKGSNSRRASTMPPASALQELDDITVNDTESPLLATVKRASDAKIVITVVKCTLFQLQHIVRSIAVRFDLNSKDRAGKKALAFELAVDKTVTKAGVSIEALPPLLEPPPAARQLYAVYGGPAVEVVGFHTIPACHFAEGGTIEMSFSEKAPGVQLVLLAKYGVTTKLTSNSTELMVEGKKVGQLIESPTKASMTVILVKGSAPFANKVSKSLGLQALDTVAKSGRTSITVRVHVSEPATAFTYTEMVTIGMGDAANAPTQPAAVKADKPADKPKKK